MGTTRHCWRSPASDCPIRLSRSLVAALLPNPPQIVHCGAQSTMEVTKPVGAAQHTEPHLLIGTPSKLLDPVNGLCGHTFDASSFICVILDEMDQLLARNLSDMLTSLMTFLPSNSRDPTLPRRVNQALLCSPQSMIQIPAVPLPLRPAHLKTGL
jgi:hypothetical protein